MKVISVICHPTLGIDTVRWSTHPLRALARWATLLGHTLSRKSTLLHGNTELRLLTAMVF